MGDARVDGDRQWDVLWIHYEAEELRVQYRPTMSPETARRVVVQVLASGGVPPMSAARPDGPAPRGRAIVRRLWGTAWRQDKRVYLIYFIDHRCLVSPVP